MFYKYFVFSETQIALRYVLAACAGVVCYLCRAHGMSTDLKINWIADQASPSEATECRSVAIEPIPKQRHM